MNFRQTAFAGLYIIEPHVINDNRGHFMEFWNHRKFAETGLELNFVQINHSRSIKNTLRGLHYQVENIQGRLAWVTSGEIFDVAVDLRRCQPTFGKYFCTRLSSENKKMIWIPPGFAHGFLVLSEFAEFQYCCTDYYNPAAERCIIWNDPQLKIDWPVEHENQLILSEKDKKGSFFSEAEPLP
ncbi:MAG: dTDP-4-dehydrorhamnose 3,5-epimerase [Candidatus Rifleibacteriota bacterium]